MLAHSLKLGFWYYIFIFGITITGMLVFVLSPFDMLHYVPATLPLRFYWSLLSSSGYYIEGTDLISGWDLVAEDEYDTATCTATTD